MEEAKVITEEGKVQRELMNEKEFEEYIADMQNSLRFTTFNAVSKYKSVRRAIRRNHLTYYGYLIPSRPFNNRGNSCSRGKNSRSFNEEKKKIYASIKEYRNRHIND